MCTAHRITELQTLSLYFRSTFLSRKCACRGLNDSISGTASCIRMDTWLYPTGCIDSLYCVVSQNVFFSALSKVCLIPFTESQVCSPSCARECTYVRVTYCTSLFPILRHINSASTFTHCLLEIRFNSIVYDMELADWPLEWAGRVFYVRCGLRLWLHIVVWN